DEQVVAAQTHRAFRCAIAPSEVAVDRKLPFACIARAAEIQSRTVDHRHEVEIAQRKVRAIRIELRVGKLDAPVELRTSERSSDSARRGQKTCGTIDLGKG